MGRAPLFVSIGYGELVEQELCSVVERLQDISRSSDRSFENVNKVVGAGGREGVLAYYPELPHIVPGNSPGSLLSEKIPVPLRRAFPRELLNSLIDWRSHSWNLSEVTFVESV